jgi:phosphoglycolate phosphatase-like HAD superfamily hydrolase
LLHEAERLFDIALDRSVFIGDSQSDVDAGRAAGCPTHLVHPADTRAYRTAFQRALLAMSEAVTS